MWVAGAATPGSWQATPGTDFLGTTDNQALELHVDGLRAFRLVPNGTGPSVIGGSDSNLILSGIYAATIAGGGPSNPSFPTATNNRAYDDYGSIGGGGGNIVGNSDGNTANQPFATIGGGGNNTASSYASTVGGGADNTASGTRSTVVGGRFSVANAPYCTIGGGGASDLGNPLTTNNRVYDKYGTVGGGGDNVAGVDDADTNNQTYATVSGGEGNTATGNWAAIGGGFSNTASGAHSALGGGIFNTTSGVDSTVGGGNSNNASDVNATVSGGANNAASGGGASMGGGTVNAASGSLYTVGGGGSNTASGASATVGGGKRNVAAAAYATVSGGGERTPGDATTANFVYDDYGTIGGGGNNVAGVDDANTTNQIYATVSGGVNNTASGARSTIAGGKSNLASGDYAAIGGGQNNTASNDHVAIGGSNFNGATGVLSTIPGGSFNTASGDYSFAAGRQAKANHAGAFVWADSNAVNLASMAIDQFNVRAAGGTRIFSDSGATVGVQLAAGDNAWSVLSDAALKENFAAVDTREILERLGEMPVGQWNLVTQDPSIQHIGPTAQDFYAAFGVGADERRISTSDADGVALAAIQGLYQMVQDVVKEKDAEIAELKEAVGVGSVSINNESLGFVWLVTWILMGGLLAVGVFIALRLRKGVRL